MVNDARRRSYTTLDGNRVDREAPDDSEDEYKRPRQSSYAYDGLLSQRPSPRGSLFPYPRIRRRFSRYFTCALTAFVLLFILWLLRSSWLADFHVRSYRSNSGPAPWEKFPFLKRYHGGIRHLVLRSRNKPEYPVKAGQEPEQDEATQEVDAPPTTKPKVKDKRQDMVAVRPFNPYEAKQGVSVPQKCYLDPAGKVTVPLLYMHQGIPSGFPDPVMGSYSVLDLDNTGCFDRYGRLGPYGLGYMTGGTGADTAGQGRKEAMALVWRDTKPIDYDKIDWADAQARCLETNKLLLSEVGRDDEVDPVTLFGPLPKPKKSLPTLAAAAPPAIGKRQETFSLARIPRKAIVIRTWLGYEYDAEDKLYLRALINEASIQSGGEYTVHFLIHVKDEDENRYNPWIDDAAYKRVLRRALPKEFRGMGTLWSENLMRGVYAGLEKRFFRDLPVYGSYRSLYMPMQYFAHLHPEYEHFWHWEMDARYTGNYYHLFDKLHDWTKMQPRKGLWERNGRFYVPSEHGSWVDFSQMVRVQTEHGTAHRSNMYKKSRGRSRSGNANGLEPPVWGPLAPEDSHNSSYTDQDIMPPVTYAADEGIWGVGEDADLITLNPLFDPDETNWILAEDVTGYNTSQGFPPRRTAICTASRLSRRLLNLMHTETAVVKRSMFTEMWPGSVALHHGLKAVYAPHPVYIDRKWPTDYLAAIFNNGRNGASGGARSSVFSDERQHNFLGTTWYYHAGFAGNLWKRWMGLKVDNDGGEEAEKAGEGRMCLPGMLLHPVKQVDLDYSQGKDL